MHFLVIHQKGGKHEKTQSAEPIAFSHACRLSGFLIVAALNLHGSGRRAVEQDLDFDTLPASNALSIREVLDLSGWSKSHREVLVASFEVKNVARTNSAGGDTLDIQRIQFARVGL